MWDGRVQFFLFFLLFFLTWDSRVVMSSSSYFKVYSHPHFFSFGKFGFWSFNLRFPHFQTFFSEKAVPSWKWRGGGRGSRFSKVYPCLKDKDRQRQRQRQHIPNCMFQWSFLPSKHSSAYNHQWLSIPCLGGTLWVKLLRAKTKYNLDPRQDWYKLQEENSLLNFRSSLPQFQKEGHRTILQQQIQSFHFIGQLNDFQGEKQNFHRDCSKVVQRLRKGCATAVQGLCYIQVG